MKELAIIADDLTSAMDCGIQVARSGLRTCVILGDYGTGSKNQDAEVISIDTDTRGMPADEAYRIVREAAFKIRASAYKTIYKSVDSTLRGNLGAEMDAVMDIYDFDLAVVAPAFPLYGRTTANGRHFLDGVPLTRTEFACDPRNPVKEDDLVRLLSDQSRRKVGLMKLDVLRSGARAVLDRIRFLLREGVKLVVFDAQVEDDLLRIIRTVSVAGYSPLWVGSTGLARHLPRLLSIQTAKAPRREVVRETLQVMLVSGSVSEVTRRQLSILRTIPGVLAVEMRPFELMSNDAKAKREIERCRSQLTNALNSGNDVALYVRSSKGDAATTKARGRKMGFEATQMPMRIANALATVTKQIASIHKLRGLVLTGGDTAKTVCRQMGAAEIELIEEVEPGIPVGRLVGTDLFVVTKAGGFGTPHSLVNSLRTLKQI